MESNSQFWIWPRWWAAGLLVLLLVGWSASAHAQSAPYQVTFEGNWTTTATPDGVPAGAHFSPLIGAVHNDQVTFWQSGGTASTGIESMAEIGGTSALKSEITNAGSAASSTIERSGNIGVTAEVTVDITLSPTHPLVTLVTMIAPSPDWFVGVADLSLLDAQNKWLASHTINLFPYDAGTEDGTEFSLSNAATDPQGTITSIEGTGKFSNEPMATLTFTLQDAAPEITSATTFPVDEGTTTVTTLTAVDANDDPLTWTIPADAAGGADAAQFTLSSAGVLAFATAPDYEAPADADTDNRYEVTVQVSDGATPVTAALEVTVANVIELTAISGPATVSFDENGWGRVATFTASSEEDRAGIEWVLGGDDAAHFTIDSPPGALRFDIDPVAPRLFAQPPDFDAPVDDDTDNAYALTLLARAGSAISDTAFPVTVTVTDVDEDGTLSLSATRPALGVALTATLADADGVVDESTVWTWERSAGRNVWAAVDGADAAAYTPVAADTGEFLRVTATYTDEHGSGKTVREVAADVVRGPLLTSLTAETTDSQADSTQSLFPAFNAQTLHYGIGCNTTDTMTLTVSGPANARISVDGVQAASATAISVSVGEDDDVSITVTDTSGARTTYTVHCMADELFEFEMHRYPGATDVTEDLYMFTLQGVEYLVALDRNGVPRIGRSAAIRHWFAIRFTRVGADGAYRYAYAPKDGDGYWILDENLEVIDDTVRTVAPLTTINWHDFRLLEDGNYLLMAWEPATRDLSGLDLPFPAGQDFTAVSVLDSAAQIVTPDGEAVFNWNSWDQVALEDCVQHRFPVVLPAAPQGRQAGGGYAHINGMDVADGVFVGSLRGCSQVVGVDLDTEEVIWRMGRTNLSDEEWRERGLVPPLDLINDPEGEFCGQHTTQFLPNGNVFFYDNGVVCVIDPLTFEELGREGRDFSRAVEYALDLDNDEAVFVRDHSLHGERVHLAPATGSVDPLDNGDWLVSWGRPSEEYLPNNEAVTLVDPDTGQEKLAIRFTVVDPNAERLRHINASVVPAEALAPQPTPLTAEITDSPSPATFHTGAEGAPQVVVAFSRPVVDFAPTTPSLSVTGATVASVSAHVVAGAPANAYLVTLTPDGDGAITFGFVTDQPCADGGICTADGTPLSEVPTALTIPGPVTASFGAASYSVNEGESVSVVVELDRAHGRPGDVTIPLAVESGSTATATDYTLPLQVTFGPSETRQTVSLATHADTSLEEAETVEVTFGALPSGVNAGTTTVTSVTITDRTPAARFNLTLNPTTIVEGGTADVRASITNGVTFTTDQTLTLGFSGSATQETDYTIDSATLSLLAGQSSVATILRATDDADTEPAETIRVAVHHETTQVATQTATVPASDQPAVTPQIAVRAGRNPAQEAEGALFTVTRTGETTTNLTVAVEVTASGSMPLAGTPPTAVTFSVGQENVSLAVPTVDDTIIEGPSERSVVRAEVVADPNTPPLYLRGSPASAEVTVEDDDEAEFGVTVAPNPVAEGSTANAQVAITNGVTFTDDQTVSLTFSGVATRETDYTVGATTLTLTAGQSSVVATLSVTDDGDKEPAESVHIIAQHAGREVGRATLTIAASEDTKPPTLERAEVLRDGRTLRLTFSEPLDEAAPYRPAATAFAVTVAGAPRGVRTVTLTGETVVLGLARPVGPGQEVTVSYTAPESGSGHPALQDPAAHVVASFVDAAVDNQAQARSQPPGGSGGGGGGGGSGSGGSPDAHGNTAAQATVVSLGAPAPWRSATSGQLSPASDVDYFTFTVPQAGVLVAETTGATATVGTVWQDGVALGTAASGGAGPNFRLTVPVHAGPVVVAVRGQGEQTGAYRLVTRLVVGFLENPGPDSFQSGIGVVSGWVCGAARVEIALNGVLHEAAYGTERLDTEPVCGASATGFGVLFNWNLLGDGAHEVVAFVDGIELTRATVTVTTLGEEFVRGVSGECTVADFPSGGETATLAWQEAQQSFVLAEGSAPTGASRSGIAGVGLLENPSATSFQSGVGVLSGWVCAAEAVTITLGDLAPQVAGYGTERLDTLDVCGDTANGFGLLFNWNLLGDGEHEVIATVDGTELARTTVRVTTLGEEFVRGATGECIVADFPHPGETVTLTWQQTSQNFVLTDVE